MTGAGEGDGWLEDGAKLEARLQAVLCETFEPGAARELARWLSRAAVPAGSARPGGFKMMNRAVQELLEVARAFGPHGHRRKVGIFGSARTAPEAEESRMAEALAAKFVAAGYMVITGAGGGVMAAAQKGAGAENSFGLRISLPFENRPNETIAGDPKLVEFEYFFTRKLTFARESDAFVLFPGGFGTLDEGFEILTLMQTGKMPIVPVVMVDRPGGDYWEVWRRFILRDVVERGFASAEDLQLFHISHGVDDAFGHVAQFYSNFVSYGMAGDELVMRLRRGLRGEAVELLNGTFAGLLERGSIVQRAAAPGDEALASAELRLVPRARQFGNLRRLIDAVNSLPTVEVGGDGVEVKGGR